MQSEQPGALVDDVRTALSALPDLGVHEHVSVLDGVHKALQDALAELDEV